MPASVSIETVQPRTLAAVHRDVPPGNVGAAWGSALDKVWTLLRSQPGLRSDGHNVFLYHHPQQPGDTIGCDFGVEVTRAFESAGEVTPVQTPSGEAAVAVHRGPYSLLRETHAAIQAFMLEHQRESAGWSWEIYGDPTPNPADTETTIYYLLK